MEKTKLTLLALTFCLAMPITNAFDLGVLQKAKQAEIPINGEHIFTVLFWNTDNSSYPVKIIPREQEDLLIFCNPCEFVLNQSKFGPPYENAEYVSLPSGDFSTYPVKILVKPRPTARFKEYDVLIDIIAGNFTGGISIVQKKTLSFKVFLKSSLAKPQENPSEKTPGFLENATQEIEQTVSPSQQEPKIMLLALFILAVLIASLVIYKLA